MSEFFSTIIKAEDRPYEWAKAEMENYFEKPDRFWITGLGDMQFKPGVHVSIFHRDGEQPDIWRVYWSSTDSVKYSILVNYKELKAQYPQMVALLENNGRAAYEQEFARREASRKRRRSGKAPHYAPLDPVKRERV